MGPICTSEYMVPTLSHHMLSQLRGPQNKSYIILQCVSENYIQWHNQQLEGVSQPITEKGHSCHRGWLVGNMCKNHIYLCTFTINSFIVCVCVCVCIYIYVYTHTHTHTHTSLRWAVTCKKEYINC